MKFLQIALMLFFNLLFVLTSSVSHACYNGDKSKVLLVIAESDDGQENKVIGEINTCTHVVSMTSASYFFIKQTGDLINIESDLGHKYSFDRRETSNRGGFCFAAIYGD